MNTVHALLQRLRERQLLTELDLHFADLMCRLSAGGSAELALAAALTSNSTGSGHVCLDLRPLSGRPLIDEDTDANWRVPDYPDWIGVLRTSPVVGRPGEFTPLVLSDQGRLYLYRYWRYERIVVEELLQRARAADRPLDEGLLKASMARLFTPSGLPGPDWQKLAAATSLLRPLSIISGGPGTGKTSTVVRILALLQEQTGGSPPDVALAAPTGKAAARLQESIRQAKRQLPLPTDTLERIPEEAVTLHRLLGSRPDSSQPAHNQENPLSVDALILDEVSMVDVALMAKLLLALPRQARLILLGDRDQLASVEAGAVLGDICGPATGPSETFARRLARLTDEEQPRGGDAPLANSVTLLRHSYRFAADSGIGRLADAVNRGDQELCLALLQDAQCADVALLPDDASAADLALAHYRDYLQVLARGATAQTVFEAFNRFRLLCALRRGPGGVEQLNLAVEQALDEAGLVDTGQRWYAGRPVMITCNDHNLRLYNGDIGIIMPDASGDPRVCFVTADSGVRQVLPSRLPQHETAYAMTVHKSQGSEFDRVLLVLPDRDAPLLSRELVYTAVTRSRTAFQAKAKPSILGAAVSRRLQRESGLRQALWPEQT